MGHKKKPQKKGPSTQDMPFVSVCTPTYNRRPFIPIMLECFRHQTYPRSRIEWIIIDDGTDPIKDLIDEATDLAPFIKYYYYPEKMSLGKKRNTMHEKTKGSILVYMDDDDYYPPERVEHAVTMLRKTPKALCAGSSEMYIYFKHIQKMVQFGPYGPNHATAGTFAFKRELLLSSSYQDHAALAEERAFLRDYTVPFVQLDPMKTILVFSHVQNTFDKKKLLDNPHPQYVRESIKTVDEFVKSEKIKKFFMEDIDEHLAKYQPGDPTMKPDVLKQMKEIEEERKKMQQTAEAQQQAGQPGSQIIMETPEGKKVLDNNQILEIIKSHQHTIQEQQKQIFHVTSLCEMYRVKLEECIGREQLIELTKKMPGGVTVPLLSPK